MKTQTIFFFIILVALISCASQKSVNTGDRDGLSVEKAIVAKSVDFEYEWLQKRFPGSSVTGQSLMTKNGVPYDRLDVLLSDGKEIQVYFDISSFFGKW